MWFRNSGNGVDFSQNTIDAGLTGAKSVFVIDVDDDGLLDVVSAGTKAGSTEFVKWYKAAHTVGDDADDPSTDVTWTAYTVEDAYNDRDDDEGAIEVAAVKVYVADLDGDDKLDVLYADEKNGILGWSAQGASATVWGSYLTVDYDASNKVKWVVAADMTGSNRMDVVAAKNDGTIPIYENRGGSPVTWTERTPVSNSDGVTSLEVVDIDGDGVLDIAAAVSHSDQIRVWLQTSDWTFASAIAVEDRSVADDDGAPGADAGYLTVVDLDADGDLDIVATNPSYITWYENDCTIAPTPAPSPRPSYSPGRRIRSTRRRAPPSRSTRRPGRRSGRPTSSSTARATYLASRTSSTSRPPAILAPTAASLFLGSIWMEITTSTSCRGMTPTPRWPGTPTTATRILRKV
jgi:hypothetical protein